MKQVIDHLGKPVFDQGLAQPWSALMTRAATYPNVHVKLSGFGNIATLGHASAEQLRPFVEHVLGAFGAQRVMAASNWPVSELWNGYADTWNATVALLDGCSDTDQAAILGETATRFYGLPRGSG